VLLIPFQKQQAPLSAMRASLAERRLLLEVFVVACVQKGKRKSVVMKQLDPNRTITPVSDVRLVIGPAAMSKNAVIAQQDFIPMKLNQIVVKFVKLVVTIRT